MTDWKADLDAQIQESAACTKRSVAASRIFATV